MESDNTEQPGFQFLNDTQVQKHFPELNNALLRGKHITQSITSYFGLLDEHEDDFAYYYLVLYNLRLERRRHDNMSYFYLDFPNVGRGKISNPALYAEMDAKQTIVACILANLYFSNFFSYDKKFQWEDIQYEIEHGEHRDSYQQLFFGEIRSDYTDKEWEAVNGRFRGVITFFTHIGLVEKEDLAETYSVTILPTIHHFIEIFRSEIENIDDFLKDVKL